MSLEDRMNGVVYKLYEDISKEQTYLKYLKYKKEESGEGILPFGRNNKYTEEIIRTEKSIKSMVESVQMIKEALESNECEKEPLYKIQTFLGQGVYFSNGHVIIASGGIKNISDSKAMTKNEIKEKYLKMDVDIEKAVESGMIMLISEEGWKSE